IPNHMMLHELLHLRRVVVERIPQLMILENGAGVEDTHDDENTIEHTVIVPRENDYRLGSKAFWNKTAERLLASVPCEIADRQVRRERVIRASLDARYCVTDLGIKKAIDKWIEGLGEADYARAFVMEYEKANGDKEQMARLLLKATGE